MEMPPVVKVEKISCRACGDCFHVQQYYGIVFAFRDASTNIATLQCPVPKLAGPDDFPLYVWFRHWASSIWSFE